MRHRTGFIAFIALFFTISSALGAVSFAQTLPVSSTGGDVTDTSSFIEALGGDEAAYADGNTIVFLSDVELSGAITVRSGEFVISGTGCYITRAEGYTGALLEVDGGSLTLGSDSGSDDHPSLTLDSAGKISESAAIVVKGGSLTVCPGTAVTGCNNPLAANIQNSGSGGAILVTGGSVEIKGGDFSANEASNGGALSVLGGEVTVTGGSFNQCKASNDGGAFYVGEEGSLAIGGIEITENSAPNGGAIYNCGECVLSGVAVTYCTADSAGGGIYNIGDLTMLNCALAYCTADLSGGGLVNTGEVDRTQAILNAVQITSCEAAQASAVLNSGVLTIAECEMNYNTASECFTVVNYGTTTMNGGSISSNTANGWGGGIVNYGTYIIDSGSVSSNKSKGYEYGLAFFNYAAIELRNNAFISFNNDVLMIFGVPDSNDPVINIESSLTANTPVITLTPAVYDETSEHCVAVDYTITAKLIKSESIDSASLADEIEKTAVTNDAAKKKAYSIDPEGALRCDGRVKTDGDSTVLIIIVVSASVAVIAVIVIAMIAVRSKRKKTAAAKNSGETEK